MAAASPFSSSQQEAGEAFQLNLNTVLSEEEDHAQILAESLTGFLAEVRTGEYSARFVDADQTARYAFYYDGLRGLGARAGDHLPLVLKSYSMDGESYFLTIAFGGERDGAPYLYKMVEVKAVPREEGYVFQCPFPDRTARLQRTQVGEVTFHHGGDFDAGRAKAFAEFRAELTLNTESAKSPLDYYCFASLDELLKAYGFVYDVAKCNFLGRDLGFAQDGGRMFVTGTGRPDYIFGYLPTHLREHTAQSEKLYRPFVVGMSTYYGGYGLTGEGMEELKGQFRARLAEEPEIDWLAEFRKGRGSSVNRHFSYFVMSAFLCEAVVEGHGFDAALRLAYCGADGERFFPLLKELLDVDETNFHAVIQRLIVA